MPVVDNKQEDIDGVVAQLVNEAAPTDFQFTVPIDSGLPELRWHGSEPRLVGQQVSRFRSSVIERDEVAASNLEMISRRSCRRALLAPAV